MIPKFDLVMTHSLQGQILPSPDRGAGKDRRTCSMSNASFLRSVLTPFSGKEDDLIK